MVWQYWGFRAGLWLAPRMPRGLGYRICALGGELYFWLNRAHSQKAVENFAVIMADEVTAPRVRLTARRSFRNYAKSLFDFFRQGSVDPDAYETEVLTDGFEHVDAALARGCGAIIVTPHFGNWDLAGGLVGARGYPIIAPADRFEPPAVDALVRYTRDRVGLGTIPLDQGSLRGIIAALRRNQIVAILFDRPQREGGVEVTFFGERAWLPAGPARLSLRSGAPIIFAYVARRPGDRTFFGHLDPPIAYTPTGDEEADVRALTRLLAAQLENLLRQYPDQWYMFRRMWPERGSAPAAPPAPVASSAAAR